MTIRLGVIMNPIHSIQPHKDSSFAMMLAAQRLEWEIFYIEQKDIWSEQGKSQALTCPIEVFDRAENWWRLGAQCNLALEQLDIILLRQDPPFNMEYIYTTYLLEQPQSKGCLIANAPQSIRDLNEKFSITQFTQCITPTLVTRSKDQLKRFINTHDEVVLKPLDGMGGSGIYFVTPQEKNTNVIIDSLTREGTVSIMAQKYVKEIVAGDKRILLIGGKPVPYCLARIPAAGEWRGNLAAGASWETRPLTERDHWICGQIAPMLIDKKIYFAGIDVIGDYLTEINITSPAGIRELDKDRQLDIAGDLLKFLAEQKNSA